MNLLLIFFFSTVSETTPVCTPNKNNLYWGEAAILFSKVALVICTDTSMEKNHVNIPTALRYFS